MARLLAYSAGLAGPVNFLADWYRCQRMMRIAVMMAAAIRAICAGLWLERRLLFGDLCTETSQHVPKHQIPANTQPAIADLSLRVPVTEMKSASQ